MPDKTKVQPANVGPRFSLRMRAQSINGLPFDIPINTARAGYARLGPDEWLVIGITLAVPDAFHSLVDITHRNVGFRVSGPRARDVLNSGCPRDLSDVAFPVGAATRTLFHKAEIVLLRHENHFHIECGRSFAPYVRELLEIAARDWG